MFECETLVTQEETERYFWNKIFPVPIQVLIPALDEGSKGSETLHQTEDFCVTSSVCSVNQIIEQKKIK